MSKGPGVLTTLRHRDFALLMGSFTTSTIGTWAYNVALAVWLLDETGSPGWVAASTVARFVPSLILSAYGGVLADRFEQVKFMAALDMSAFVVMSALAAETALGAPPIVAVVTAAMSSMIGTSYIPAAAAMTPRVVPERELGAANALRNAIDNVCVIAGPGVAGVVLIVAEPWVAIGFNALTFLASAVMVISVRARSEPVDVTEGGEAGPLRQMLVGIRTIATSGSTATLVAFSVIATFVFGIDTVLFVVLSDQVLGTGAEGYGYLLAGLGVGGIAATGLVNRLDRLPRLGTIILLGMAGYCLPTLLFLFVDQPAAAFVIQAVRGASTLVVDVLALTALQRSVAHDRLARVFGAFDSLLVLAVLLGSLVVAPLLHLVDLDGVIWVSGLVIPVLCLVGLPRLRQMDEIAMARRTALAPKVALLQRCDLFASVTDGSLDQLADQSEFLDVIADVPVVTQGEAADAFYVVETGVYAVSSIGEDGMARELHDMGPGEYFGEIGLIEAMPRTATVTPREAGRLLRVSGAAFITALTEDVPSAALLEGATMRLAQTHPTRKLTRSALSEPA